MNDGCVIPRDALFVPPRFVPNNDLLQGLGATIDPDGWVDVDATGRTSVPGVWAAGNIVDPRAQVITAAGAGSAAGIAMNADLVDDDVRDAVRDLDHLHTAQVVFVVDDDLVDDDVRDAVRDLDHGFSPAPPAATHTKESR